MDFVVMGITFKMVYDLLPICGKNVPVCAMEALIDLISFCFSSNSKRKEMMGAHTFAQAPV